MFNIFCITGLFLLIGSVMMNTAPIILLVLFVRVMNVAAPKVLLHIFCISVLFLLIGSVMMNTAPIILLVLFVCVTIVVAP